MAQTYETLVSGTTTFGQLYGKVNNLVEALRSAFSGASFPTNPPPVDGQFCYRTDENKLYAYVNSEWKEVVIGGAGGLGSEISAARGTKSTLDQRLDVSLNEDGTLKASTSLNPSQWASLTGLTFEYVSSTSFAVTGNQTDIYRPTRRLKINLSTGPVYSEVVSSSYSSGTNKTTVQIFDAVINTTLSSVEHSLFLPRRNDGAMSLSMIDNERIVTKTSGYTTTLNDSVILCDATTAPFTVTVMSASTAGAGKRQAFKKIDSSANAVTINCGMNIVLTKYGETLEIISDGTNWRKITDLDSYVVTSDVFSDFVVSGLLGTDPGATLTMTTPGGIAYVTGRRIVKSSSDADLTYTYTASRDTYDYLKNDGTIVHQAVSNGAAEPSQPANTIKLQKVITNATEITSVVDLRTLKNASPMNTYEVTGTSQAISVNTRYIANSTSQISFTLPSSPSLGDVCIVDGKGTGGWKITPASGQSIQVRGYISQLPIQSGYYTNCIQLVYANNNLWIAEIATEMPYVPIAVGGKGYIMGGNTGSRTNVIGDLIFGNETSQAIAATLDTAKDGGAGVNSSTKGYIMGGNTGSRTNVIEDLIFANETSQAIAATLDTAKDVGAGVNSSTKGYIMGGNTGSRTNVIEDLIFANETSQAIAATLDIARDLGTGVNSSTKGYIMGGNTGSPVATIEDLIFANETSQAIAAMLNTARRYGAGVNSSTKGYIMGGNTGGAVTNVIEGLIFANETSQAIAATLDAAKDGGAGVQYGFL